MNVAAVIDQHVEEAGFLAGLRDHAVRLPTTTWRTCWISTIGLRRIWMRCR